MAYELESTDSPRFDEDVLYWYYGNTFSIYFHISLTNDDGSYVAINPTDRITTRFYKKGKSLTHEFVNENLVVRTDENGKQFVDIELDFTDEISKKFDVSKYTYCITYYGADVTTIGANFEAEVEECH